MPGCFQPADLSSRAPAADLEEGAEPGAQRLDASFPAPLWPSAPSSPPSSGLGAAAAEGCTVPLNRAEELHSPLKLKPLFLISAGSLAPLSPGHHHTRSLHLTHITDLKGAGIK